MPKPYLRSLMQTAKDFGIHITTPYSWLRLTSRPAVVPRERLG